MTLEPSLGNLTRLFGGSTSKSFDVCAPGGPPVTLEPSLGDLTRLFDGSTSKSFDVGAPGVNPVTLEPYLGVSDEFLVGQLRSHSTFVPQVDLL